MNREVRVHRRFNMDVRLSEQYKWRSEEDKCLYGIRVFIRDIDVVNERLLADVADSRGVVFWTTWVSKESYGLWVVDIPKEMDEEYSHARASIESSGTPVKTNRNIVFELVF